MSITPEQTKRLLQGSYTFKTLGFSLFVARLRQKYTKDQSQETLQFCTDEINTYLSKHKRVMEADAAVIANI